MMERKKTTRKIRPKDNIIELKRGDTVHRIDAQRKRFAPGPVLVFSFIIIFIGSLSSAVAAAYMTDMQREVFTKRQQLEAQLDQNRILAGQIPQSYTLEEIERIAGERLGMAKPDPSQIIYINVPPVSHVFFNPEADVLPPSTSFWEEMGIFLQGLINRVFGG
jgi:cell division protein FtsL